MTRHESPEEHGWRQRLGAAAEAVEALHASYEDELETRDGLIVRALDEGWTRSQVARWARLSPARVTRVVARRAAVAG